MPGVAASSPFGKAPRGPLLGANENAPRHERRRFEFTVVEFRFSIFLQVIARRAFEEGAQFARTRRVPQFAQRFRFDLPDAFARDRERLADFFERVLAAVVQAKAHLDDFFLARRQRLQHRRRLFLQIQIDDRIGRRNHGLVFDEVAEMRVFFFADRRFERNRLLRDLQNLAHFGHRNVHALGDFLAGRRAIQFLHELAAGAHQLVDRFDHVHRNTNRARLIGDRARDGLPDPPRCIRRKLVPAAPLELVHRLHQTDVAFLNQVEKLQSAVGIFLGDRNDQSKIGLDQFFFGLLGFRFAAVNERQRALQFGEPDFAGFLDVFQLGAARAQFLSRFGRDLAFSHVRAALQAYGFAFQRLQPLDRAAHLVDQPLFFKWIEIDGTNGDGNLHTRPCYVPLRADVRSFLRFQCLIELRGLLQSGLVQFRNLVDVLERLLGLVGDLFFGQLFVVKLHDLFDRPHALAQIVADGNQLFDDDRRARDGLHHHQLPALDALGDGDFALARQQRHGAHLTQVHADGIVRFFQRTGCQVEVAAAFVGVRVVLDDNFVLAGLRGNFHRARSLRRSLILINFDSVPLEGGEQIVDFFRGMDFCRKRIVYFVVEQVAALFAHRNELTYRIIFLFKAYCCHKFLPLLDRHPRYYRAYRGPSLLAEIRAGWRTGANHGEFSQKIFDFCLKTSAPRRCPPLAPCVARFTHFWGSAPAAKYTYIDAFNGKTVTRQTLLRYTLKSHLVNVLIRGFLWKNSHPDTVSPLDLASGGAAGTFGLADAPASCAFHVARNVTPVSRRRSTEPVTALLLFP